MENVEIKLITVIGMEEETVNAAAPIVKETVPTGVSLIKAPQMWSKNYTGKGVTIAVIDTGCATAHPDLKGQIIGGRNFTKEDNGNLDIFEDYNGHGTHVCGTIAAKRDNVGVIGVAPDAKLLVLKVLDKNGRGDLVGLINAIKYAVEKKVDIISMSLGGSVNTKELYDVIKLAVGNEILVVCAAGNSGDNNSQTDEVEYPGGYNEVISVGAVSDQRSAAVFTNSNKEIDLVAPGVNIISTFLNNSYRSLSGTSMATPHVSGALALVKQWAREEFGRELSEIELYAQLIKNTIELNMKRTIQGNGMLNLDFKNYK
ncbi:MAG: S8 family peptidase [Clostridium sp.]|uniref:S8 family peptidase n=1 Tax=Clostridium sp. TaxID=1506 RepID=UPI003F2F95D2